jgi:hypothetical protein
VLRNDAFWPSHSISHRLFLFTFFGATKNSMVLSFIDSFISSSFSLSLSLSLYDAIFAERRDPHFSTTAFQRISIFSRLIATLFLPFSSKLSFPFSFFPFSNQLVHSN